MARSISIAKVSFGSGVRDIGMFVIAKIICVGMLVLIGMYSTGCHASVSRRTITAANGSRQTVVVDSAFQHVDSDVTDIDGELPPQTMLPGHGYAPHYGQRQGYYPSGYGYPGQVSWVPGIANGGIPQQGVLVVHAQTQQPQPAPAATTAVDADARKAIEAIGAVVEEMAKQQTK